MIKKYIITEISKLGIYYAEKMAYVEIRQIMRQWINWNVELEIV